MPEDPNSDRVKIFVLPTFMTAGNLFCGYQAVITIATGKFAMLSAEHQYHLYRQGILWILLAFVFDFLDGMVARLVKRESAFGKELDSLADLLSFGMAPALLVASIVLEDFPRLGWVASFASQRLLGPVHGIEQNKRSANPLPGRFLPESAGLREKCGRQRAPASL